MRKYLSCLIKIFTILTYILCFTCLYIYLHYNNVLTKNENETKNLVTIEMKNPDAEEIQSGTSFRYPTKSEYEQISKLEQVEDYELNQKHILLTDMFKNVYDDNPMGIFNLKGVDKAVFFDLKFNNIDLVDGRTFSTKEVDSGIDNTIIINDIFAKENGIKVNDEFLIDSIISINNEEKRVPFTFKVIGIFKSKAEAGNINYSEKEFKRIMTEISSHSHDEGTEHGHSHDEGTEHGHSHDEGTEHGHSHDEGTEHGHSHDEGTEHGHSHDEGIEHGHSHDEGTEHDRSHSHDEGSEQVHTDSRTVGSENWVENEQSLLGYESSQIQSLQLFLIKEELNTFYVTNKTLERYREHIYVNSFSDVDSISVDYLASYELKNFNGRETFVNQVNNILPDYFYPLTASDSLKLWFQNSIKNKKVYLMISVITLAIIIILTYQKISTLIGKNIDYINYLILSGVENGQLKIEILKMYAKKDVVIYMLVVLLSPKLAMYIISKDFVFKYLYPNVYQNIHQLTRHNIILNISNTASMYIRYASIATSIILLLILLSYLFLNHHTERKYRLGGG
ncbi:hypothetical protein ACTGWG_11100 [Streptococcus suis]